MAAYSSERFEDLSQALLGEHLSLARQFEAVVAENMHLRSLVKKQGQSDASDPEFDTEEATLNYLVHSPREDAPQPKSPKLEFPSEQIPARTKMKVIMDPSGEREPPQPMCSVDEFEFASEADVVRCDASQRSVAVERWERIVLTCIRKRIQVKQAMPQGVGLTLRSTWIWTPSAHGDNFSPTHSLSTTNKNHSQRTCMRAFENRKSYLQTTMSFRSAMDASEEAEHPRRDMFLQHLVRHPDKPFNLCYMLIALLFICYDIIMFPMMAFNLETNIYSLSLTAAFWTCDIVLSSLVGFHTSDGVEMRLAHIVRHYLQTWFLFDFIVCTVDLVFLAVTIFDDRSGPGAGILRIGRSFRAGRFLRAARVLRILKTAKNVVLFLTDVSSELMLVWLKLLFLIFLLLLVNHYIACGWFAIGYYLEEDYDTTWLKKHNVDDASVLIQYMMSFHWSMTQFTPATNNIAPTNPSERVFAIFVVLFALVMFSNFLSNLTNALAEIRTINQLRLTEMSDIREFLKTRSVSSLVRNKVWHFYRCHYKARRTNRAESDVAFFRELPQSVRSSMYKEIYAPSLMMFYTFKQIVATDWLILMEVCETSLSEKFPFPGEEIFAKGTISTYMYLFNVGSVTYLTRRKHCLTSPIIICEPTIWCYWWHCGVLTADTHCEVLGIHAEDFEATISKRVHSDCILMQGMKAYSALYVQHIIDSDDGPNPINDIALDHAEKISTLARGCYRDPQMANGMRKFSEATLCSALGRSATSLTSALGMVSALEDSKPDAMVSEGYSSHSGNEETISLDEPSDLLSPK